MTEEKVPDCWALKQSFLRLQFLKFIMAISNLKYLVYILYMLYHAAQPHLPLPTLILKTVLKIHYGYSKSEILVLPPSNPPLPPPHT